MARSLRPRKARPSYASLLESDSEAAPVDEGSSSDDFQPLDDQDNGEDAGVDASDAKSSPEMDATADDEDGNLHVNRPSGNRNTREMKAGQKVPTRSNLPGTSAVLSRSSNRPYKLASMAGLDNRQRAEPIYYRAAHVERLSQSPLPFRPFATITTNSWDSDKLCAEKYIRASGYNIGRGPIWGLMEDRSWWKESHIVQDGETETEATRRPRMYEAIKINAGLETISEQEARMYLPAGSDMSNEFSSASIKCFFGVPGKNTARELKTFDSFEIADHLPESKALVFFAGGPVWGIDWCPIYVEDHPHRSYKQYVAVAPLPSQTHSPSIGHKCSTPFPACVQIWSYAPKFPDRSSLTKGKENAAEGGDDYGEMVCELVLCFDCGPAQEIKWCPLPAHDPWVEPTPGGIRKLGLLAGTFEDGSLSIFAVPDPDDLRSAATDKPIFVKIKPMVRIELEETSMWSLDWANSERIAVGCTNGSIAVYDIRDTAMNESMRELLPTHYLAIHQSAIRSVQWIPVPSTSADGLMNFTQSPTMIASGGYDGCEIVTDLRDGCGGIVNRTRDIVLAMTYSLFSEGVVTVDLDYIVKCYSMAPGILGRGSIVMEAGGPVWSLHTSDYHPTLALGSADGSLLTTNMLRPTRRSATTPFLFYKIFQMDYNRKTGEFRMLEQSLPQEIPDRSSAAVAKKGKKRTTEGVPPGTGVQGTGAWSSEISVTRVAWNNGGGLARAPVLVSGTASGLCRVDWLLGHFQDERVPYGGIEYIRNEIDAVAKPDEDDGI